MRTFIIAAFFFFAFAPAAFATPLTILDYSACSHIFGLLSCNQQTEVCATNPTSGNPGCFPKSQATNFIDYTTKYPDLATCTQQSNCPYACTKNNLAIPTVYFCNQQPINTTCTPTSCNPGYTCTNGSCVQNATNGNTCTPTSCNPGYTCTNGSCVQNTVTSQGPSVTLINPLKSGTSLTSLLNNILDFVIQIGSIIVILMLVFVGFKFVLAQGKDAALVEARKMLLWTIIGALVLLGAKAISAGILATVQSLGG